MLEEMATMGEPASVAVGGGVAAIVSGLTTWAIKALLGREVTRIDKALEDHSEKLTELENTSIRTVSELTGVREQLILLRGEGQNSHRERMDELRRVHDRIDTLRDVK